jgi:formiminotetrahydrofolate cyclodeaminase
MTLQVAGRRKDFSGERNRLSEISAEANHASQRLLDLAAEDTAAYQEYRRVIKQHGSADAALRRIIATPLEAATLAALGLDLCADAQPLVPASVDSDLRGAAALLWGAVRAILLSVDVNVQQLSDSDELRLQAATQRQELERRALQQAERILDQV